MILVFWFLTLLSTLALLGYVREIPAGLKTTRALKDLPDQKIDWPSVTLIAAARDEEVAVEAAVRSWLALDYPDLQIVAVDDRSQDRTPKILDSLRKQNTRLDVLHVAVLPPRWLGKNHALMRRQTCSFCRRPSRR